MGTKPPQLPPNAPKDLVDFVACTTDTYTLRGGPQPWVGAIDLGVTNVSPDVTFEPGEQPGSINAVIGKGGFGVTVPVSVNDGSLSADTSSLPDGMGKDTSDWLNQFNAHLKDNGKKVGGITLDHGKVTITKIALTTATGAGGTKKVVAAGVGVAVVASAGLLMLTRPGQSATPPPATSPAATISAPTPYPNRSWNLNPLTATFDQSTFSTSYAVSATGSPSGTPAWVVTWSLQLTLVDPAGKADPSEPGSGAAVDLLCNNAGVGTPTPATGLWQPTDAQAAFRWFHPSPADSQPPGKYHCEHLDQGPHGHQGLITVTVNDGFWTCTESYKGTHDGKSTDPGQPGGATCAKTPALGATSPTP